jgi:hypothetical protein
MRSHNLLDCYNQHVDNNITLGVEFVLMLPVIGTVLFMAQRAINAACDDPTGSSNSKLTWANWIWIVLGSIMLILILIGTIWGDVGVAGNPQD